MKSFAGYLLAACMVLMCFGSCRHGRVIPKKDFAAIYADMFLADQWLNDNPAKKRSADTSGFYDAVFKKHGYTFEDYDASVNYYLDDPSRYAKILDESEKILDEKLKKLKLKDEEIERYKRIHTVLTAYRPSVFWPRQERDSNYLYPADSVCRDSVILDSLTLDSLRLDSLRLDSLLRDSLRLDSLRIDSLLQDSLKRVKHDRIARRAEVPSKEEFIRNRLENNKRNR